VSPIFSVGKADRIIPTKWKITPQPYSIAGPEGIAQKLKDSEASTSFFPQPSWLKSYDGWKKHLKDDYGLSFGLSAYW